MRKPFSVYLPIRKYGGFSFSSIFFWSRGHVAAAGIDTLVRWLYIFFMIFFCIYGWETQTTYYYFLWEWDIDIWKMLFMKNVNCILSTKKNISNTHTHTHTYPCIKVLKHYYYYFYHQSKWNVYMAAKGYFCCGL